MPLEQTSENDRQSVLAEVERLHHEYLEAKGFFETFNRLPTSRGFNAHVGPMISYLNAYRNVPPDRVSEWREDIETFMTSLESELQAPKFMMQAAEKSVEVQEWLKRIFLLGRLSMARTRK